MARRALMIACLAMALAGAPAAAQDYDGTDASAGVQADGDIVVSGEGFIPNSTVSYEVDFTAEGTNSATTVEEGTTQADANGDVRFEVQGRGDGRYEIVMTDGTNRATAVVAVGDAAAGGDGSTAGAGGALPTTGSERSIPMAQLGVLLVMMGGVAVYVAKRRRSKAFV